MWLTFTMELNILELAQQAGHEVATLCAYYLCTY